MVRPRTYAVAAAAAAGLAAAVRHRRGPTTRPMTAGGTLAGHAGAYDVMVRLVLGGFHSGIAADAAATVGERATVLDVGCGPGHLSLLLAGRHGLHVTGLDLDPAMVERAEAAGGRSVQGATHRPTFVVGDVASLPFPDGSFDLVVSTLAMHHWAEPASGLAEIGRVLRSGARALIWDLRPGIVPMHPHVPDPRGHLTDAPLRFVAATPWRWPWTFRLTQRFELVRAAA